MATEYLPPPLDATSEPPALFDGNTRLYMTYTCPFAQRVWIARNYKGLQDKIKLVPALEHDGKVIGESLDLIKYVDTNFEGPSLLPDDPDKQELFEELLSHTDQFIEMVFTTFKGDSTTEAGAAFDQLEPALTKHDGPFLLGDKFSLADIAFIPFVERFEIYLSEVYKYDITAGRPKVSAWFEAVNDIDAYKQTKKTKPKELVDFYKKIISTLKL
ncbi:Protein IN2-1-like protein B [Hibiscus syriacus]|uniref:Protein IN2-1-like protein B n=1 Tax=Hibiscus syriacus TaxID=106335 RepID=A0A6A2WDX8_HIBSY|nr:Protein IN2-1-like protein B [Hibiscus syriacus]